MATIWKVKTPDGVIPLSADMLTGLLAGKMTESEEQIDELTQLSEAFIEMFISGKVIKDLNTSQIIYMGTQLGFWYKSFMTVNDIEMTTDELEDNENE